MNLIGATLSVLLMVSACKKVGSEGFGTTKHTMETSQISLTVADVNKYVASSSIVVIADVSTNRAVVIHYGEVVDALNILTGEITEDLEGKKRSKTALGVFTIHALEYCPPWYLDEKREEPCASSNPLGEYGLWFKDNYLYGIHGRPSDSYSQGEFGFITSERSSSRGCVVFPEASLTRLVDRIFSTHGFENSKAVEMIKQYRATNTPTNVVIRIVDDFKGKLSSIIEESEVGDPLKVDVKLVVVDLGQWDVDTPKETEQKLVPSPHQGLVSLLQGKSFEESLQLVQDCELTRRVPLYKLDEHLDGIETLGTAAPQTFQRLPHIHFKRDRVFVSATVEMEENNLSTEVSQTYVPSAPLLKHHQVGWLKDISALKCGDYYWSKKPLGIPPR